MPDTVSKEIYFTFKEFADDRRISVSTVKNLITAGELAKVYITEGSPRISQSEARRYDEARAVR